MQNRPAQALMMIATIGMLLCPVIAEARSRGPEPVSGVRATVGLGIGKLGLGLRAGLDAAFFVLPWLAPTVHLAYGRDGMPLQPTRDLFQAQGGLVLKIAGGPGGSLLVGAGLGYAYVNTTVCARTGCDNILGRIPSHELLASFSLGTILAPRRSPGLAISAGFRLEVMQDAGLVPTISFGVGPRIRLANE